MSTATFYVSGSSGERLFEKKLNATKVTPKSLGALMKLVAASIWLCSSEGDPIGQENGAFSEPLKNGLEYEVTGDPVGQPSSSKIMANGTVATSPASGHVASKLSFSKDQIKNINSQITINTVKMRKTIQNLEMAPECVQILKGILTVANCTNDFSMSNEMTTGVIKLMTTPSSFRGTLVQIANSATSAFVQADRIMGEINSKLSNVPEFLLSSLEAGSLVDDPSAVEMLNMYREEIEEIAKYCAKRSTEVATFFHTTQDLIAETLQAATTTNGFKTEERQKIIADLEASKVEREILKAEQTQNADALLIQQERTKEAREIYKDKADKMGDLGYLFTASMLDGLQSVAGRVVDSAGNLCNTAGDLVKNVAIALPQMAANRISSSVLGNSWGFNDSTYRHSSSRTQELNMVQAVEYYCAKELPSSLDEMRLTANEDKEYFAAFTNFRPTSKTAKILCDHCKKYVKLLDKISKEDIPTDFDKAKAQVQIMQVTAASLRRECEDLINAEAQRMKATEGILQQLNASAAQAQFDFKDERTREDELQKKATEFTREIAKLTSKLNNSNTEKVEIEDAIKYLSKGLEMLAKMNKAWVFLAKFFTEIQTLVSTSIKDSLELYLKTQKSLELNPQSDMVRRKLIEVAIQGSGLVRHAIFGVGLYQDISRQYVLPELGDICHYLTLSRDEARKTLEGFEWNFDQKRREVKACIESSKSAAFEKVEEETIVYIDKLAITEK